MTEALEFKISGIFIALLVGLGVPMFLLGPALFGGLSFKAIAAPAVWSAAVAAVFGLWLVLVCALAEDSVVKKVVEPFQGSEAVVLFLPYMLILGSRALWRRVRGRSRRA